MKVYLPHNNIEKKSGIGKAIDKQIQYLNDDGIECVFHYQKDVDLVHINSVFDFKNRFVLFNNYFRKLPLISHGHSTRQDWKNSFNFWKALQPMVYRNFKDYYSRADYIITPTPYSKSIIEGYGYCDNVVCISNGINVEESNENVEENIKKFLKICGLNETDKVILGIGHVFYRKGIDDFFRCAQDFKDYKFVWCGYLPHIILTHDMRKLLRHKPDNVIVPGFIDSNSVRGAMHFAKCFFFPSREETEGIVVLEALAGKCPLIIRDIGVYDYWLKDGVNCYKGRDAKSFSECIRKVLNNDNTSLINEGYKVALQRDKKIVSNQLAEAYKAALNERENRKNAIRKVR